MTTTTTEPTSLEFGHYLRVLRRRIGVLLTCLALGLLGAFAYLSTQDQRVTATTTVDLNVISSEPFNTQRSKADLLDPATEVQMAQSAAVLSEAASELGVTPSQVRTNMTATPVSDASIMRISYTADSVGAAEEGADVIANAYLDYRTAQANDRVEAIIERLDEQRKALREDLVRLNTTINKAPANSPQAVQASSDRQLTSIELDSLSSEINNYRGIDTSGGTVLTAADQSPTRAAPSRALVIAIGLALGLLLGIVLVFVRNAMDPKVREARDVRRAGGGEVLGTLKGQEGKVPATAEELDVVRSVRELLLAALPGDPPVVAVADFTKRGAGTDFAVNLAQTFAETGRRVALVMTGDSGASAEQAAAALGMEPASPVGNATRFTHGQLDLIQAPVGTVGLDVPGLLDEGQLAVIAIPRGAAHSSLLSVSRLGHAVVVVAAKDETRKSDLRAAADELAMVDARVHGTVFLPKDRRSALAGQPTKAKRVKSRVSA